MPYGGIHIPHRTSSQCSVETVGASSQFRTGSGGDSLQFPQTEERGGPEGKKLEKKLVFDVDADVAALDRAGPSPGAQCH